MMPTKIEISYKTILFILFVLILLWVTYQILEIILLVFVAFIIMSAIRPLVDILEKKKIPRVIGTLLVYLVFVGILTFILTSLVPPFITQMIHMINLLPNLIGTALPFTQINLSSLTQQIAPVSENIFKVTVGIFNNVFTILTLFVVSIYMVLERRNLDKQLTLFFGGSTGKRIFEYVIKVEERLGYWVRGQLALGVTIGVVTGIALFILGLPYALPLGILAGVLEFIPIIGPIIAMIPSVLLALTMSPILALITIGVYILIQQFEAHIVVPLVMKTVVGLPPLATIIAFLIGAKLGGIVGALLAIPVLVTVSTIISEYIRISNLPRQS